MMYQEKKIWANMVFGLFVLLLYIKHVLKVYRIEGESLLHDTVFWSRTMLLYIGIGIVVIIALMIVFHILMAISEEVSRSVRRVKGEDVEDDAEYFDVEDEMDRLIRLKAGRIGYVVFGLSFIGGLISMALNMPTGIMLNIMYLSFMAGVFFEGGVKLYLYKRGVSHG